MNRTPVDRHTTVARMAKVRSWHDVSLLSFDLQTVEFAYAAVCSFHAFWGLRMTDGLS